MQPSSHSSKALYHLKSSLGSAGAVISVDEDTFLKKKRPQVEAHDLNVTIGQTTSAAAAASAAEGSRSDVNKMSFILSLSLSLYSTDLSSVHTVAFYA